jgi:uncharacterized protein (PEP-CTERM system associated)
VDPGAVRTSDLFTQITPVFTIIERGAHSSLNGTIALPVLLYARTGNKNNSVRPEVALSGSAELISHLFYVDASANVSQQFVSPFGPQPVNLASTTNNRNTAQSYRISPYLKGRGANDISYEVRDSSTWTVANGIAAAGNHAYTNQALAHVDRAPRPVGWAVDYDRTETKFTDSGSLVTQAERARLQWRISPDWQASAIGGYEDNRFPLASYTSAIYGAQVTWKPSDRTTVDASWEHRFFGGSYHVSVQERTALSVWSLRAFRDITTYPQQLATLGEGSDVNALLNQIFSGRVPDEVQRQTLVDDLIRERGLPAVLSSPLSLFSEQVTLQQSVQGTVGLLGARNSVFVSAFHRRSEPVLSASATALDLLLLAQTNNTQTGADVVWSHRLTSLYTLSTSLTWTRVVANDGGGAHSSQANVLTSISAPISPLTNVFAGVRFQRFWSDVSSNYDEAAGFVGITHRFR